MVLFSGGFCEPRTSPPGPGMPAPKYCSVTATLKAPCWGGAAPLWDLSFACPFALRPPWLTGHNLLTRCVSNHPWLQTADPARQGPGWPGRTGDGADTWVLARREPDGFYYRAQIKAAPELERQGALLVEFEAPQVTGPRLSVQRHHVVLKEEAIQLSPPTVSPLCPGDKVLAPWEPNGQRYGPGTVLLGLETRKPERGPQDEEITVHFWNGKMTTVPPGGAVWVPPAVWQAAVERLLKPVTREPLRPLLWAPCCSLLGPGPGCVHTGLSLGTPFLCPLCPPHTCYQPLCLGSLCCCPSARPTWWPLPGTGTEDTARELPGPELKPTPQLLPLEGPQEGMTVHRPRSVSPSTFSEDDLENDPQMCLPQRLLGSSTLNADPVLEKSPRQSGLCQPAWRYWRRNGPEPRPRQPELWDILET
ncbi:uncharacterized protein C11orf16 homolog [Tenrec ecaudatus]|uniref:uncharacterized protein C11orf16 homolog n=1 Tax=Tenrec ecaudatus TaxID=94439 RepID=UPI003F59F025